MSIAAILGLAILMITITTSTRVVSATDNTLPPIPVELNQFSKGVQVSNVTLSLNLSDDHFHLKGSLKNTLPEARDFVSIMTSFEDKSTNTTLHTVSTFFNDLAGNHVKPNETIPFDIDTGYGASEGNQFRSMKASMTI